MGTFDTKEIRSDGNLKAFVWQIYYYFMGKEASGDDPAVPSELWPDITCEIFVDGTLVGTTPENFGVGRLQKTNVCFTLASGIKLYFQYYSSSVWQGMEGAGFNLLLNVDNITLINKNWGGLVTSEAAGLKFSAGGLGSDASATRKFRFSKYEDTNIFAFWMAPYSATTVKGSTAGFIKFKDTNENLHWNGHGSAACIENGSIVNPDGTNALTKANMFSYEARTGYLDFISHCSLLSGTTKVASCTDIYDCTTVNFGDTLSIKDGANFLAIGSHSMVPLS